MYKNNQLKEQLKIKILQLIMNNQVPGQEKLQEKQELNRKAKEKLRPKRILSNFKKNLTKVKL